MRFTWRNRAALALGTVMGGAAATAAPQVGDSPPPLQIAEWVQGKPVDLARDAGRKLYLIEFWATWCPPCKASVPLLSDYQTKYGKDLTIIGVTDPDDRGNTAAAVRRFVKKQGSDMNYTVAIDDASKTFNAYFDPMAPVAIPHSYLIGREGKIVWQGSPLDPALADVIPAVLEGTYDVKTAKLEAEVNRRLDALNVSAQMGQWGVVWDGLVEILQLDPGNLAAMSALTNIYSLELRNIKTFRKWVRAQIDAHHNNGRAMLNLADTLLRIEDLTTRVPDLALEAADKAYGKLHGRDAVAVALYAKALYQIGALDVAIVKQQDAVALAGGAERDMLNDVLDYYRLCKKLQETIK